MSRNPDLTFFIHTLDGDGREELLVGAEDGFYYLLSRDSDR